MKTGVIAKEVRELRGNEMKYIQKKAKEAFDQYMNFMTDTADLLREVGTEVDQVRDTLDKVEAIFVKHLIEVRDRRRKE